MKIALLHHSLQSLGGGEKLTTTVISALNEVGITPTVFSMNPVDASNLNEIFGKQVSYRLKSVLRFHLQVFGIYQRLLFGLPAMLSAEDFDLWFNLSGTFSPLLRTPKNYFLYVHFPFMALTDVASKYNKGFWRIYFEPYRLVEQANVKGINAAAQVLCNSKYTHHEISRRWHAESTVIYPPVAIDDFSELRDKRKKNQIVSVGRFTPEKNHMMQLEIAGRLREYDWYMIGSASTPYNAHWFKRVRGAVESMGLKNVHLCPNIKFDKLKELLGTSKVFLHSMENEHFGIATAEAIAAGCIPVVHDSGGSKEVVPITSLRYRNAGEAAGIVRTLLKSNDDKMLRSHLFKHVSQFDESKFKAAILGALNLTNTKA